MGRRRLGISSDDMIRLAAVDERIAAELLRNPEELIELQPSRLDASDALRLAASNERFAEALIENPEKFAPVFNFSEVELRVIREIVPTDDFQNAFSYDA